MASYAALLSLLHTLNQIKNHPRPPISIHEQQLHSLTKNLTFFQDFLECYPREEEDDLDSRITDAAYAAEDVIETHIIDQILAGSTSQSRLFSSVDLYGYLKNLIKDMDLIKKEVMEIMIKDKNKGAQLYDDHLLRHSSISTVSASPGQSSTRAEFDEVLINEVLDQLYEHHQSNLQIISIDGMGGIGKTTFATNIYSHPLIVQHFDVLAWVTISQAYSMKTILLQVLREENIGSEMSEEELGERVHKKLWGRRYLIVMDDIWSTEALDKVRRFFPNNKNGSKIMTTTRLSNLALELSGSHVFRMKFLDDDKSWGLLCRTVFGKVGCPPELVNIGKEIARNCRGLPLSIVVIGGLLKKSNSTRAHWDYILQNMNSLVNLEDGEYCLQILRKSYEQLPIYLKPCFLYMGVFPEDSRINVSKLIKLWVAEGILRPVDDKSLEEVAEKNVNELIDRNLILVDEWRWNGKAKSCKIHDLLRDACIRDARKQRFLFVLKHQQDLNLKMERRISIQLNTEEKYSRQLVHALESASVTRSLVPPMDLPGNVKLSRFLFLRVYSDEIYCLTSAEDIFRSVNLRFLDTDIILPQFSSSWFRFWNLQTLMLDVELSSGPVMAPSEIWEMPLLRHVMINDIQLLEPENGPILQDLRTLSRVCNFKCSEGVIKRIPNIKILKLKYLISHGEEAEYVNFGLNNLGHLKQLQSLNISIHHTPNFDKEVFQRYLVQNLSLWHSLKKLSLRGTKLNWEECTTKIGSLPLLEFLRLDWKACCGAEWETVEGRFCSLKILRIVGCCDLRHWRIQDSRHFPRLEHLILRYLVELEDIPSSIGDIPTLKSIQLHACSSSAINAAKRIKEEQEENGNEDLQIGDGSRRTSFGDASLKEVENTFRYQREKYEGFVRLIRDLNARRIDYHDFVSAVTVLCEEYPHLIRGLLLPEGCEFSLHDDKGSVEGSEQTPKLHIIDKS